jgi:hypothetical protein
MAADDNKSQNVDDKKDNPDDNSFPAGCITSVVIFVGYVIVKFIIWVIEHS